MNNPLTRVQQNIRIELYQPSQFVRGLKQNFPVIIFQFVHDFSKTSFWLF